MALIKTYNPNTEKWEIISSTNAAGIYTKNESLQELGDNVDMILYNLKDDVDYLKKNVAWLAKYGGGGSGGAGGSGVGIDASIIVNGNPTNSEFTLTPTGINIEIQSSNKKLTWNITAMVNNTTLVKGISNATSLVIKQSEWEKVVSQKASLNITAYNAAQLITVYWNGTVNISSIKLECDPQHNGNFMDFNTLSIPLSYALGSTGAYKMYVNGVDLDNGRQYNALKGNYSVTCGDINNVLKTEETDFFIVGINKVTFKLENVNATEVFYEVSTEIVLTSDEPIIYNTTLSTDENSPTEITFYSDPFSINIPFIVYYNSTRTFAYNINYTTLSGETLSNNVFANNIMYNTYISNSSLQLSNITEGTFKVIIGIQDMSSTNNYYSTYYIKLVAPASGLLFNPHDEYTEYVGNDVITNTDKIFDFNASNAKITTDYKWNYTNKFKNITYIANINNPNALCSSITADHSLRLQNGAFLKIDFSKDFIGKQFPKGKFFGFTLEISYKCDYHPDDERTILQWGSERDIDKDTGLPNRGIMIRDHDLYIGGSKIMTLTDEELINICITYYSEDFEYSSTDYDGGGTYFIYIDGVIEAVGNVKNSEILPGGSNDIGFYLGAAYYENEYDQLESTAYTDLDLYRFVFYDKCLAPYDVLIDYLNNCATANFIDDKPDISQIEDGLKRNFITYDEASKTYDSFLYNRPIGVAIGGNNFENSHDTLADYFNVNRFINNGKLSTELSNYTIPIPIVYIYVPGWSWTNFISPATNATADTILPSTAASFQYYDQTQSDTFNVSNNNSFTVNCTVKPQGTSTLADYVKNVDIIFDEQTVFCPKKNWLPEYRYTLKADIVDSSHSINASIGKFINTEFGLNDSGNEFYPFSPTVKSKFLEFTKSTVGKNCFPDVNLKHGVEGFPVFVIIQFNDGVKTLGVYQFILGRSSARNLGFETITALQDNGLETPVINPTFSEDKIGRYNYPLILTNATLTTKTVQGVWIEFGENNPASWDHQALTDEQFKITKFDGPFWQNDMSYYSKAAEIKFSTADGITTDTSVSEVSPFISFVQNIIQMPVGFKRYSTASGVMQNMASLGSSYKKLSFDGTVWHEVPNETHSILLGNDALQGLFDALPLSCMQKYFCIMMMFGLVDNFQKNMPIKIYKNDNGDWEIPILGIYDTDTGLGQNNQAVADVETSMWLAGLTNENYNFTEKNLESNYSTPVGTGNKMWYIDCEHVNKFGEGKNSRGSMWASAWYDMLNYLYNNRNVGLLDIANYYFENYFVKQTEGCGELLFNLTYISKYITKYATSDGNKTNQIQKLHGRRRHQVKHWLNERIVFLHSLFYAFKPANNVILSESEQSNVAINAALSPTVSITTNAPILLSYTNQGSDTAFSFCRKNIPQEIFFGASQINFGSGFSAFSHMLSNPNQIIKIGEGEHPLYDIGFGNINNGSLVYLSEYNCSTPNQDPNNPNGLMTMDNGYMRDRFCRVLKTDENGENIYRSEIRNIDFRNTYPAPGVTQYILDLSKGFDKLQSLYINNSCITGLTFPENISIRDFNIANSNIIQLTLSQQNFITELDITNCKALQRLTVNNCLNLQSINIDNTNQSLSDISISDCAALTDINIENNSAIEKLYIASNNLKNLTIKNCKNLYTVEVSIRSLENISITNCENFSKLNFIISANTEENKITESAALKKIDVNKTNIKYAGYALNLDSNTIENIVDLYYFKNLETINFLSCKEVEYIQLCNENNPINLSHSFNGCTNLKRIYGHYKIKYISGNSITGMFKDCKNYSIHGNETATWNGKEIGESPVKTPMELLGKTSSNLTTSDLYVSGTRVTNIRLNNTTSRVSEFNNCFENTNCTAFDLYYFLNLISAQIKDGTITGNISLYREFYGCPKMFSWENNNNPSKRTFEGCTKITSINSLCSTDQILLPSPTNNGTRVTADDGIYSPLVNCTSLSQPWTGVTHFSKWLYRRKSGNYKITNLSWISCGYIMDADNTLTFDDTTNIQNIISKKDLIGNFTDFFVNLPQLNTINSVFNNSFINYSTITLPSTINGVYQAFRSTFGIGIIDIDKIFAKDSNGISNIQQISSSFYVTNFNTTIGKAKFYIYDGMFNGTPSITTLGYSLKGNSYGNISYLSFNGDGIEKQIINGEKYIDDDTIENAILFPFNIFDKLIALQVCSGFFMNVTNTDFGENIPSLPGDALTNNGLFKNCQYITNCEMLFKNVNFAFTLSPNGFANRITTQPLVLSEMFYHDIDASNRSKIQGSIPFKFLYHGETVSNSPQINVTTWKPWTSYAYKTYPNTPVINVVDGDADTDYPENSYVRKYEDAENTTYKYNNTIVYLDPSYDESDETDIKFYRSYAEIGEGENITIVYTSPVTYTKITDEEVETTYNNPADDPFFNTTNKDIHRNPTTSVFEERYSVQYNKPCQYISKIDRMFYGCIGLQKYSDNIHPNTYNDKNVSYIPEKYTWKKESGRWVEIDHSIDSIKYEYTGFWSYNGDPTNIYTNYLYLETSDISLCEDQFSKYTGSSITYFPSNAHPTALNYIAPPDLLRYCANSSNTDITGLFENCGLNYPQTDNGYMTVTENNNYFATGIQGRLCPYMLYNLSSINNISRMFKFCRCISCFNEGNETYLIPKTFFNYAKNISSFVEAFKGMSLQPNTNIKVFGNINASNYLDLRCAFNCMLICPPSQGTYNINTDIFANKNVSNYSGIFSNYDIIPDNTATTSGTVRRVGNTDGYNYVPRLNITYNNMFSSNRIPNQQNTFYVYYKKDDTISINDTQTKNQNYNYN